MTVVDQAYQLSEGQRVLTHAYGDRVTFLHNPFALSLMRRIGHPDCVQPALGGYVRLAYQYLAPKLSLHLKVGAGDAHAWRRSSRGRTVGTPSPSSAPSVAVRGGHCTV